MPCHFGVGLLGNSCSKPVPSAQQVGGMGVLRAYLQAFFGCFIALSHSY